MSRGLAQTLLQCLEYELKVKFLQAHGHDATYEMNGKACGAQVYVKQKHPLLVSVQCFANSETCSITHTGYCM